jgi:hypothetical protein
MTNLDQGPVSPAPSCATHAVLFDEPRGELGIGGLDFWGSQTMEVRRPSGFLGGLSSELGFLELHLSAVLALEAIETGNLWVLDWETKRCLLLHFIGKRRHQHLFDGFAFYQFD